MGQLSLTASPRGGRDTHSHTPTTPTHSAQPHIPNAAMRVQKKKKPLKRKANTNSSSSNNNNINNKKPPRHKSPSQTHPCTVRRGRKELNSNNELTENKELGRRGWG